MFLTMKSNVKACITTPFNLNHLINMWCLMKTSCILVYSFPMHVKLVDFTVVQIINSVEDKTWFFYVGLYEIQAL
jgi:hypothetical protein